MNKETIQSIIEWHTKTFPNATLEGQLEKFKKERKEWLDSEHTDISELADMFIVACGVARFDTIEAMFCFGRVDDNLTISVFQTKELEKAIDKKMEINRKRKWNFQDGQYQHKE